MRALIENLSVAKCAILRDVCMPDTQRTLSLGESHSILLFVARILCGFVCSFPTECQYWKKIIHSFYTASPHILLMQSDNVSLLWGLLLPTITLLLIFLLLITYTMQKVWPTEKLSIVWENFVSWKADFFFMLYWAGQWHCN